MIKNTRAALFILLSLLYSPTLSAQQIGTDGSPRRFIDRTGENHFQSGGINHGKPGNFIRIDSITSSSITVTSYGKRLFQYNSHNKISEQLISGNAGTGWEDTQKLDYYYNSQDQLSLEIDLGWNINQWDSLSRIDYMYEDGNMVQKKLQNYTGSEWLNWLNYQYTYGPSGSLEQELQQIWTDSEWDDLSLSTMYYSSPAKLDSILNQIPSGAGWQNDKLVVYYYAANVTDVDSIIAKTWSASNWVNLGKQNIINNENHDQIELIDQDWLINNWMNSVRFTFTYNAEHYVKSIYGEMWDGSRWTASDVDMLLTNPDGFTAGFWGSNKVQAFYSNVTRLSENNTAGTGGFRLFGNYPNPFNPSTTIKYEIPKAGNVELKVFDILGREIAVLLNNFETEGIHQVRFNAANLPGGIYLYQIRAGSSLQTGKMILLK